MRKLSAAPCDQCGYSGPGYYQPSTHPCAEAHHKAEVATEYSCGVCDSCHTDLEAARKCCLSGKLPDGTRQPAMTDAELELEAEELCTATDADWKCPTVKHYMTKEAAMALAKKYRGKNASVTRCDN